MIVCFSQFVIILVKYYIFFTRTLWVDMFWVAGLRTNIFVCYNYMYVFFFNLRPFLTAFKVTSMTTLVRIIYVVVYCSIRKSLLTHVYEVLYTFVKDTSKKNKVYIARHMDFFLTQIRGLKVHKYVIHCTHDFYFTFIVFICKPKMI